MRIGGIWTRDHDEHNMWPLWHHLLTISWRRNQTLFSLSMKKSAIVVVVVITKSKEYHKIFNYFQLAGTKMYWPIVLAYTQWRILFSNTLKGQPEGSAACLPCKLFKHFVVHIKYLIFLGGSPGLVVIGRDSHSKGRGFESRHCILDGHFFTSICCKKL